MMSSKPIHVLIPALNEKEKIGEVIEGLKDLDLNLNIVVLDDGSNDNTAEEAWKREVKVVRHMVNLGQWAALRTLFHISSIEEGEIIVTLDADGQHSPESLTAIISPLLREEADLVIGSRFRGQNKPHMSTYRYFGIQFFNKIMKLRTGLELTDCTSGYKAYRADLLSKLLPKLEENQYGALEAIIQASKYGARICEVPITSKSSNKTTKGSLKYVYNLLRTIFKSLNL